MPTYDFVCSQCNHAFELLLNIKDTGGIKCPLCNKEARKKISGGTGIIYKGSGFYSTDYNIIK